MHQNVLSGPSPSPWKQLMRGQDLTELLCGSVPFTGRPEVEVHGVWAQRQLSWEAGAHVWHRRFWAPAFSQNQAPVCSQHAHPSLYGRMSWEKDTVAIIPGKKGPWRCPGRGVGVGCKIGSCRDQEGRRGSDEVVPGPSVFPSREPSVSGNFWPRDQRLLSRAMCA